MFFGQFEHSIDNKGRLTIPAKFKEALAGGVVITRGLDGCLWAFTKEEWRAVSQKIAGLTMANTDARRFTRFIFSGATDAIPDRAGRVVIPQNLQEYAGINGEAVVAGMLNRLEIWNPQRWADEQQTMTEDPETLAAHLADLGIL
ncbi:MAG: division/cell wall cluster transcriptional repressor MraZ [Anaerolineae bacterium]